jgi:cytoskeletal protein CcmA (bactofilin family)
MFKKEGERGGMVGDTVIAMGVKVEGEFASDGNVVIEGEIVGSVHAAQDLQVGDRARLTADVTAANARIAGEVRGNVMVSEKLELLASARIVGDIHAKMLLVEPGAQLNGRVVMGTPVAVTAEEQEAVVGERLSTLVGGRKNREAQNAS